MFARRGGGVGKRVGHVGSYRKVIIKRSYEIVNNNNDL